MPADFNYELYYSANNGTSYTMIADGIASGTIYYPWTVPNVTPGSQYKMKLLVKESGITVAMAESGSFTINSGTPAVAVVSPNGGNTLTGHSDRTWQYFRDIHRI
jgi:hypothetical protein